MPRRSSSAGSEPKAPRKLRADAASKVEFNHALVYVRDLARSLAFYRDGLGLDVIEAMEGYARVSSPNRGGTIGLHVLSGSKQEMDPKMEGVRLYFETEDVDGLCDRLVKRGYAIDEPPKDMPWGWRHAYLKDPDGHEVSVYHAGAKRFLPSPPM